MDRARLTVWRCDPDTGEGPRAQEYEVPLSERDTVLQGLQRIVETVDPSLAFRFGCRYERCGLCGLEVDGRPALACHAPLKDRLTLKPLRNLPLLRDLTVDRAWLFDSVRALELYLDVERIDGLRELHEPPEHVAVDRCIECFCCLATCPTYNYRNPDVAGPFHFVKLAQMHFHPLDERDRPAQAARLGIERCATCRKCHCVAGIPIYRAAIAPLHSAAAVAFV